jgi:small-conductance mechanosensitive channel
MADDATRPEADPARAMRAAQEALLQAMTGMAKTAQATTASALGALGVPTPPAPDLEPVLRAILTQPSAPTAQLEKFPDVVRAQREAVQALQAQLTAFDQQLELLQRSLEPLKAWADQWTAMQRTLTDLVGGRADQNPS